MKNKLVGLVELFAYGLIVWGSGWRVALGVLIIHWIVNLKIKGVL